MRLSPATAVRSFQFYYRHGSSSLPKASKPYYQITTIRFTVLSTSSSFSLRQFNVRSSLPSPAQNDKYIYQRTTSCCGCIEWACRPYVDEKEVKKLYLPLVAAYVPRGLITHYMRPFRMAPKIVFQERWNLCQLEVLECRKVPWPNASVEKEYGIEDFDWPNKEFTYECKINLLTGRTHQIRAQLAAYGAPIVGYSMGCPGIKPIGKKYKKQFESEADRESAIEEWSKKHGKEPGVTIGLQASQISWDNGQHIYKAGPPWWNQ